MFLNVSIAVKLFLTQTLTWRYTTRQWWSKMTSVQIRGHSGQVQCTKLMLLQNRLEQTYFNNFRLDAKLMNKGPSLYYVSKKDRWGSDFLLPNWWQRDHPYIMSAKRVGGDRLDAKLMTKQNIISKISYASLCKDWPGKKVTILLSKFLTVKSSEMILFFTCILPGYLVIKWSKNF